MFGNFVTGSGYDKTGAGGDIESIFPIAACTNDVNGTVRREVDGNTSLHKGFAEAG